MLGGDGGDELASVHLASHASYYGVMVRVLMMFEQWYKHHGVLTSHAN